MSHEQSQDGDRRPRVLHIIGTLALGGIETWLVHMLRHQQDFSVRHELLLTKRDVGPYEAEVRALGIPLQRLPLSDGKAGWAGRFGMLLRETGPYTAVHSHAAPHLTAAALAAAKRAGVPIRIAHSHSARSKGVDYPLRLRVARAIAEAWLKRTATRRIGITDVAIEEISGKGWRDDPTASVLIYGFDFRRYRDAGKEAGELRRSLAIAPGQPVVGHVGRFMPVKNHKLLLDAFAVCTNQLPEARLVLVGEGTLREAVEQQAAALGLADRVIFAGTTEQVHLYMAMFDLFALPSFSEGLGIVVVEAQAAGTPALVSETTPEEATVVPGGVEVLPLAAGATVWGDAMARLLKQLPPDQEQWLDTVEASKFGIRRCIEELDAIYRSELERSGACAG